MHEMHPPTHGEYILLPLSHQNGTPTGSSDEGNDDTNYEYVKRTDKFRNKVGAALRHSYKSRRCGSCYMPCRMGKRLVCLFLGAIVIPLLLFVVLNDLSGRQYALTDWGFAVSRNVSEYVSPHSSNTTLLEPRNSCQDKMFLLIIVCSGMENFLARQIIRETWGNLSEFNYGTFARLHASFKGSYAPVLEQRVNFYKEFLKLNDSVGIGTSFHYLHNLPVRVLFLVGRSRPEHFIGNETLLRIRQEAEQHDDIIQENFIDTYNNLTIKSVMALKWLLKNHCHEQVAFFMKCDDDTFINIPNLLHFLLGGTIPLYNDTLEFYDKQTLQQHAAQRDRLNATVDYLVGHRFCSVRPVENVASKWYMPAYMYGGDRYPTYLSGAGYLMSLDVVPKLYEAALNTTLIYLEDVYVTGMCAKRAHVTRHHHPLFSFKTSKHFCSYKGTIISHGLKDDSMYAAYNFVANFSHHCPSPDRYFKFMHLQKATGC